MDYREVWKLMLSSPIQRDRFYRLCILTYQLGDVVKSTVYEYYYGDSGVHGEVKVALADLIAQIHIFCLHRNLDFRELEELGLKRLADFVVRRM